MSYVILKGTGKSQKVWNNWVFRRLQQAKEVFLKAHPGEEFRRIDDDLTWVCKRTCINYHFKEMHDYQEVPVLVERELEKYQLERLEDIFRLYSNVFTFEINDQVVIGRRIVDYKWGAMKTDIVKLFKQSNRK